MTFLEWVQGNPMQSTAFLVTFVSSLATVVSLGLNLLQWYFRRRELALLRAHFQASYNDSHRVAERMERAVRWLRHVEQTPHVRDALIMLGQTTGVADTARIHIANIAKQLAKQNVFREHPAFPGENQTGKDGWPPYDWPEQSMQDRNSVADA